MGIVWAQLCNSNSCGLVYVKCIKPICCKMIATNATIDCHAQKLMWLSWCAINVVLGRHTNYLNGWCASHQINPKVLIGQKELWPSRHAAVRWRKLVDNVTIMFVGRCSVAFMSIAILQKMKRLECKDQLSKWHQPSPFKARYFCTNSLNFWPLSNFSCLQNVIWTGSGIRS